MKVKLKNHGNDNLLPIIVEYDEIIKVEPNKDPWYPNEWIYEFFPNQENPYSKGAALQKSWSSTTSPDDIERQLEQQRNSLSFDNKMEDILYED